MQLGQAKVSFCCSLCRSLFQNRQQNTHEQSTC